MENLPFNLPTQSNKPALSQVDSLIRILKNTGSVSQHWDIDAGYDAIANMTLIEYKYLVAITLSHKMAKINKKLQDLEIKRKPNNVELGYQPKPKNEIF